VAGTGTPGDVAVMGKQVRLSLQGGTTRWMDIKGETTKTRIKQAKREKGEKVRLFS